MTEVPAETPERGTDAPAPNQRRPGNYLLQPFLQVRLGLYNIILALAFGAAILGLLRALLAKVTFWMEELSGAPAAVREFGRNTLDEGLVWFALVTAIFVLASVLISVVFTHRLVGPTVAFRRHIDRLIAGDYSARTTLRNTDAFKEVAEELNRLSEVLERRAQGDAAEGEQGQGPA